jgi:hypothetical protein
LRTGRRVKRTAFDDFRRLKAGKWRPSQEIRGFAAFCAGSGLFSRAEARAGLAEVEFRHRLNHFASHDLYLSGVLSS